MKFSSNFGGVTDPAFYPPFVPTQLQLFPLRRGYVMLTMRFLGYTKFKPFKRQFETVEKPEGQLRYNDPGATSSNLESSHGFCRSSEPAYPERYQPNSTVEFFTTPRLAQLHKEPLCKASGL